MDVIPGRKQTKVGAIPDDWHAATISEVSEKITVGFVGSMSHLFRDNGVPLLRGQNVLPGKLDLSDTRFISIETHKQWSKSALRAGDVVLVRVGYPGTACVIPPELGDANAASLVVVRPKDKLLSAPFLVLVANSEFGKRQIESYLVGGAQQVLNIGTAAKFNLPLPPRSEQESIAEVLSDVDALIASLEELLAKKRQMKRAAIQELLTGKRRLPGFNGAWNEQPLSDIGAFLKGSGVSRSQSSSGDIPCVRYGELYTDHHDVIRRFRSFVSPEVAAGAKRIIRGDVLFAGSGETKDEIGKCAAFVDGFEAYAGGDIVILRPRRADPVFLGYLLNTDAISWQKASKGQGDAVVHISARALASISVQLPAEEEQKAIANVIAEMDVELIKLEEKVKKVRELKQGMTRELLTGRIRLA